MNNQIDTIDKHNSRLLDRFMDFEKSQPKITRGGMVMYDVKGHYKFLTLAELFEYYYSNFEGVKV